VNGSLPGLAFAVGALVLWSISPFFFTATGRRVGPFATNLMRLAFATSLLAVILSVRKLMGVDMRLPSGANWLWLGVSGVMGLILAGVSLVTWRASRKSKAKAEAATAAKPAGYLSSGAWAAIWSSLFQGLGTVMARKAFLSQADLDPILATAIRIGSGGLVLWVFAWARGPLGPVLAGSASIPAGVVTTITFMSPLIVIPLGAWHYGTRVGGAAVGGTLLSLAGVALLGFG
jgi:drug/metabolite transporter (DMT)-like permease